MGFDARARLLRGRPLIGLVFELFEWMIKLSILIIWFEIVLVIWLCWLVIALVYALRKKPVPNFPAGVGRTTNTLMRSLT